MAMEIMMLPDQSVIATALLRPNWPDAQMIEDVLFIGLGTTEFGLRHARSLKNRFRNVPHKIATPSIPVLYLGGQTAPIYGLLRMRQSRLLRSASANRERLLLFRGEAYRLVLDYAAPAGWVLNIPARLGAPGQ